MPSYIIRIELHEVKEDHQIYPILHTRLEQENIYNRMYHPGALKWYALPHATYFTAVEVADAEIVKERVRRILNTSIEEMRLIDPKTVVTGKIMVVQAQSGGRPFATDYEHAVTN